METLRMEGSAIRGLVQGRAVNCLIHSMPSGLVLPSGQYLLRLAGDSPVYGICLSIEAAGRGATAMSATIIKEPPAAIATLVPAAIPGTAAGRPDYGLSAIKFAPGIMKETPAMKFDSPSMKFDTPSQKFDSPGLKFDGAGTSGMTARVIIAIRPVGEHSLVAQAGFSDLVDAVQRTGGVLLSVA